MQEYLQNLLTETGVTRREFVSAAFAAGLGLAALPSSVAQTISTDTAGPDEISPPYPTTAPPAVDAVIETTPSIRGSPLKYVPPAMPPVVAALPRLPSEPRMIPSSQVK